jgi:hypothetical protein
MKPSSLLRALAFLAVMLGVYLFFAGEIQRHWDQLTRVHLEIRWIYVLVGALLVAGSYLMVTWAWQEAILMICAKKLTFSESVGLVNITQLTKYIPGKVWSYALQMHLLSSHGISKTLALSVNVIILLSLMASSAAIGFGYIAFSATMLPTEVAVLCFTVIIVFYLFLIFGGTWSINLLIKFANKFFTKQLQAISMPVRGTILVHGSCLVSNLAFGLAGYFMALGIGLEPDFSLIVPVAASFLLSDAIGLIAFMVPGGIGVREGVMYTMLKPVVDIQICFILPVAIRLMTTVCDFLLGGIAVVLLNSSTRDRTSNIGVK